MDKDRIECHIPPEFIRKLSADGIKLNHYQAVSDVLPEDFELYARTALNETEENRENGLRKLRKFVRSENLQCPDDNHLIMMLRSCKYDIKKSKSKLKRFLKLRRRLVTELATLDMETIQALIDGDYLQILPYRDRYNRLIMYTVTRLQLDKYKYEDMDTFAKAALLFCMSFPMTQVYGISYIGDCTCDSFSIYYPIIKLFKKCIPNVLDLPCRIRRVDITNENYLCRWLFTLLRPILSEKITKRVTFHGTHFEELHNYYHVDLLPEEVCGNLGAFSNKHYREELLNFIEKLRAEN